MLGRSGVHAGRGALVAAIDALICGQSHIAICSSSLHSGSTSGAARAEAATTKRAQRAAYREFKVRGNILP